MFFKRNELLWFYDGTVKEDKGNCLIWIESGLELELKRFGMLLGRISIGTVKLGMFLKLI